MAAVTLADIRNALAGVLGESSTPTDAARDRQIQRTVEDIWYRQYWSWRRKVSNVAFNSSGVSTTDLSAFLAADSFPLPSKDANRPRGEARLVVTGTNNDVVYTLVAKEDADRYTSSDTVIWYDGNDVDGYLFYTTRTDAPTLQVTYFVRHDVLSMAADTTRIPLANPVAMGAYSFMVRRLDIDRNNRAELAAYEREVDKLRALDNAGRTSRLVGPSEAAGYYAGSTS